MPDILGWLGQNKTWVFSGIGVAVLGAIVAIVRTLWKHGKTALIDQHKRALQATYASHSPIQTAGRDIVNVSEVGEMPHQVQTVKQPHFEFKGLGFPRPVYCSQSHREGIVEPTTTEQTHNSVSALTLRFQNAPKENLTSARALNVVAQLRFNSEDWNKSTDIDYGVWLNSPCDCTDMEVGDTRELILLIFDGGHYYSLRDLRHEINREYDQYVKECAVDWFRYVKVTLIDQISHAAEEWLLQIWHDGRGWCHSVMQPRSFPGSGQS